MLRDTPRVRASDRVEAATSSSDAARLNRLLQLTDDLQRERPRPMAVDRELALQLDLSDWHVMREYRSAGGLSP